MRYGCHNRAPYKEPHRMSPNCEYTKTDLGKADARCVGCKWREQNELAIPATSTSAVDSEANQSACEAAARPDAGGSAVNQRLINDLEAWADKIENGEKLITPDEMNCASVMRLAAQLLAQPERGCQQCNHPLYCGTKCKNCGRAAS